MGQHDLAKNVLSFVSFQFDELDETLAKEFLDSLYWLRIHAKENGDNQAASLCFTKYLSNKQKILDTHRLFKRKVTVKPVGRNSIRAIDFVLTAEAKPATSKCVMNISGRGSVEKQR
jgi:hypothetical protein